MVQYTLQSEKYGKFPCLSNLSPTKLEWSGAWEMKMNVEVI